MATKKSTTKTVFYTHKQANSVQEKLRVAIRATTSLMEKKNLSKSQVAALKKYRKMLQDANNWFSWNVATLAQDRPTRSQYIR